MNNVIVIGAGVAGIQAALDIAGHNIQVHLIVGKHGVKPFGDPAQSDQSVCRKFSGSDGHR